MCYYLQHSIYVISHVIPHARRNTQVLTTDAVSGSASLFQECVCEGLAGSGLASAAASHRTHTLVPAGAHHGDIDTPD